MRSGDQRAQERRDLLRLGVFLTVAALLAVYLGLVTSNARPGQSDDYAADFRNVSGLEAGDQVRVAGVPVGRVSSVEVQPDTTVRVRFDVGDGVRLDSGTTARVQYRNLIGDRVLVLRRGTQDGASPLRPGAVIPAARTASALDLDTLLNGFRPLFAGLSPQQINQLSYDLVQVLQGQTTAVRSLVRSVGSFTSTVADREGLVTEVIANLRTVLGTVDDNAEGLADLVDSLSTLVAGLEKQDTQILDAAARIDSFSNRAADLVSQARGSLTPTLRGVQSTAAGLNASSSTLQTVLERLPEHYERILASASYGNFFNFFLCGVRLKLTDGPNPVITPWTISELSRCRRS